MTSVLGFIGLGVMGEAMCRNLARKSGLRVVAFDVRPEPLAALAADGVDVATSALDVVERAEVIFLCLPGEAQVRAVCLGAAVAGKGAAFVDAPVARTAQAPQHHGRRRASSVRGYTAVIRTIEKR